MNAAKQTVFCSKGHQGRFTDHGPMVGRGWYCPECRDDIPHADNTYGSAGKIALVKAPQQEVISYPRAGDQLNCTKNPCKACHGLFRKKASFQVKVGDIVTAINARGAPDLIPKNHYEVLVVEEKGLRIRLIKNGNWVEQSYSRCRFIWGKV